MTPNYISHYYLADRAPFLSLSDLEGDIHNPAFVEMLNKHKTDEGYMRRYGKIYLETRKRCESKLRDIFLSKGGKPSRLNPYYCVLGSSDWFLGLNDMHREIRIPIAELDERLVSLTFPDSLITMTDQIKPYYEKVYLLSELDELINSFGLPNSVAPSTYEKYWEGDFEHYIEVQIWCDSLVNRYR